MVNDFQTEKSPADDDSLIRDLLAEACEAPPVPKTVLRRLDRQVEAVWGESPGLSNSTFQPARRIVSVFHPARRIAKRSVQSARTLSVAAIAAAICICTIALLFDGGGSYSWADTIDRLQRESLVRVVQRGSDEVYWFSLREKLIAQQTPQQTRVVDYRRNVSLSYRAGDDVIERTTLELSDTGSLAASRVVWYLLSGDPVPPRDVLPLVTITESWQHVLRNGQEQVELRSQIASQNRKSEPFEVVALLDPRTRFPNSIRVEARDGQIRELSLSSIPKQEPTLRIPGLPNDLPIVDRLAPLDQFASSRGERLSAVEAGSATSVQLDSATVDGISVSVAGSSEPAKDVAIGSLELGWQPVAPVSISVDGVVDEVDRILAEVWQSEGLEPAARASDDEFMRRLYLDLTGRIPSVSEVRNFHERIAAGEGREELINHLLQSADHSTHIAAMWRSYLIPEDVDLSSLGGAAAFDEWFADQIKDGVPYDQIVRNLLQAEGRLAQSGPLLFYAAAKLDPEKLAGRTSRVFLGMRVECAQCHDDPFEPWTQNDFWSLAAYFAQLSRPQGTLEAASPVMSVRDVGYGEVTLPDKDVVVAPRLLDGTIYDGTAERPRREQLSLWLTAPENPYFARATVNRVWALMFGRGIIDPVDGFGAVNQPAVPDVLDLLSGFFIESGFDLRELIGVIARTRAYQLSSGGGAGAEDRRNAFAQMHVKVLSAEQLYDCIAVATLLDASRNVGGEVLSLDRIRNSSRQQFIEQFRAPSGRTTEYLGGIPQALTLMNGSIIEDATGLKKSGLLDSLQAPFFSNDERIRILFLSCVSREPTPEEWALCRSYLGEDGSAADALEALADILWALLNSAEFTVNH